MTRAFARSRHPREQPHRAARWLLALLASLAFHVALLYWTALGPAGGTHVAVKAPEAVRVQILRAPPPPKPHEPVPKKGQIVDIAPPPSPQPPPKEARHLAPFNRRVPEERKARRPSPRRPRRHRPKVAARKPSPIQSPQSTSPQPTKLPRPKHKPSLPRVEETAPPARKGALAGKRTPRVPRSPLLLPSTSTRSQIANVQALSGRGASDDALLHIRKESDITDVNAREFRYWGFFERIKRQVRREWNPVPVHLRYDPTGQVWGVRDRLTVVRVTLDEKGNVVDLKVVKPSGAKPLDREALRALRAASPFPHPPKALFDKDGKLRFQFGFLLEIDHDGTPHFFWRRL